MPDRTRCGLLAEAIGDEEKAAEMYEKMRGTLGKESNEIVAEIESDEIDHKTKLKEIYKRICIASSVSDIIKEKW